MSRRAELLRWCLRVLNKRQTRVREPITAIRGRLKRIERFVPGPPADTRTSAVDAGGVNGVRIAVCEARSDRCVLYLHGGAYTVGTAPLFRDFTWRIGDAARAEVLFLDYRLAPEHPFPAAAVAISPWTDLALTGPSLQSNAEADPMLKATYLPAIANAYLAGADPRLPYASPLYGDAAGLPPTLIQVGSDEILRDDSLRMAEKLRAAGCDVEIEVWPRMPHAWHLFARVIPEGRRAIERIGEFLQRRL